MIRGDLQFRAARENMNIFRYIAIGLLLACSCASAEYTMFKSRTGILLVSNNPGLHFLLDIPGENFRPVGMNEAPYPALEADGYFLQIVPGTVAELKVPEGSSDDDILTAQYKYETGYHKIAPESAPMKLSKLANGTPCATWSVLFPGIKYRHYYLSFRSGDRIITISAADTDAPNTKEPLPFLRSIAETFHRSRDPLKISWDDAGNYHCDK